MCIDGPGGSGKSTLAGAVADLLSDGATTLVHTDDMLEGWSGLAGLSASTAALLRPLAAGEPGRWRRWDWVAYDWAHWERVEPGGWLVLEGAGSWSPSIAELVGALVWVEAEPDVRLARGLARDGAAMRPRWLQWRRDEAALFARHATRAYADLVVDTT